MLRENIIAALLFAILMPAAGRAQQANTFVTAAPAAPAEENSAGNLSETSSSNTAYVRSVPGSGGMRIRKTISSTRPFSSVAVSLTGGTLGAGIQLATPLGRHFNLRTGINGFAFDYPFNIDGVYYDGRLHLKSSQTTLDWFPFHGGFHVSSGILYSRDTLAAPSSVPPGKYFELGDQGFLNSVDDPLVGTAAAGFNKNIAPMVTVGYGNIIPRTGGRLSIPVEIGAAFTGAAQINVTLNGTACVIGQGCFTFASNPDAQSSIQAEILKLNNDLKRIPVYPIVSIGVAWRFGAGAHEEVR